MYKRGQKVKITAGACAGEIGEIGEIVRQNYVFDYLWKVRISGVDDLVTIDESEFVLMDDFDVIDG